MAKLKATKVNLSTKAADVLATIREEQPKAWYFFRKKYGSRDKYMKFEDELVDKALEEKKDQFTDIDYYISPVGNRWMTYVQVQYFPKAHYAMAFHYSFIYYETYASCGAFFPMYSSKQTKGGTVKKNGVPDSIIRYTDHFFYQLSERTGIEYRSKELIRKFISDRCEHALTSDEDGDVVLKFKGGHGFGKEISQHPQFIDCRTYLGDEQLNNLQKKKCEPVDQLHELMKDGMFIKEVAISTAYNEDWDSKRAADEGLKRLKALKKLGMERHFMFISVIHLTFVRIVEDILGITIDMKQSAVIAHITGDNGAELAKKWADIDGDKMTEAQNKEFEADLLDVLVKCARQMKLKRVNRDTISQRVREIHKESLRVAKEYEQEA